LYTLFSLGHFVQEVCTYKELPVKKKQVKKLFSKMLNKELSILFSELSDSLTGRGVVRSAVDQTTEGGKPIGEIAVVGSKPASPSLGWLLIGTLPYRVTRPQAFEINGVLSLIGGETPTLTLKTGLMLSKQWSYQTPLPSETSAAAVAVSPVVDWHSTPLRVVHFLGGQQNQFPTTQHFSAHALLKDGTLQGYTPHESLPFHVGPKHVGVSSNGQSVYIIGRPKRDNGLLSPYPTVYRACFQKDGTLSEWEITHQVVLHENTPMDLFGVFELNEKVYVSRPVMGKTHQYSITKTDANLGELDSRVTLPIDPTWLLPSGLEPVQFLYDGVERVYMLANNHNLTTLTGGAPLQLWYADVLKDGDVDPFMYLLPPLPHTCDHASMLMLNDALVVHSLQYQAQAIDGFFKLGMH
jgi:hypothetical protein